MKRFLPYPLLALFVFAMWLMLAPHVTPGQTLLAAIVAVAASWAMAALRLTPPVPRHPRVILRLAGYVTLDILRSNIAVARIILGAGGRNHAGFLVVPLEMRNRTGLAVLALIVTATPGTIWVSHNRTSGHLLLHILDLIDEDEWIGVIKGRYERLLMEIFE